LAGARAPVALCPCADGRGGGGRVCSKVGYGTRPPPTPLLWVGAIPATLSLDGLSAAFARFGRVRDVRALAPGLAHVEMATVDDAVRVTHTHTHTHALMHTGTHRHTQAHTGTHRHTQAHIGTHTFLFLNISDGCAEGGVT
jgi:hypothetical protein